MGTFAMGSVKQRAGCGQRQCPLRGWSGTSPAQQFPTLALPLARVFLRVFRIVLLEQMSTIPKVGQISLYAVLRGVQGSGGSKGSEPTQSTGSLSLRLCQEPALPAAQAEL